MSVRHEEHIGMSKDQMLLPFEDARKFAQTLGLKMREEWFGWSKNGSRPDAIPADPRDAYKESGWLGWGDWLGTGNMRYGSQQGRHSHRGRRKIEYRSFAVARDFARSLRLSSHKEWAEWSSSDERPPDIPSAPNRVYEEQGWQGYGDWLGTGNKSPVRGRRYRFYSDACEYIHTLALRNHTEWVIWAGSENRPEDIPSNPEHTYRDKGWKNWKAWLGTETTRVRVRNTRPFEEARSFARSLNFSSAADWDRWALTSERPTNISTNPDKTYKQSGWANWADWLGTRRMRNGQYRPFEQAREFARSLGLSGSKKWQEWCKTPARPTDIPSNPFIVYAKVGWSGYADWLGTSSGQVRTFEQARDFARSLGLKGSKEWFEWAKTNDRPSDIPASPRNAYKDSGWLNWADWLGTNNKTPGSVTFLPFEEARTFARSLGLRGTKEWNEWNRTGVRPANIPSAPYSIYADKGWLNWKDWLTGTSSKVISSIRTHSNSQKGQQRQYRSFIEARAFVQQLGLKSSIEWSVWAKSGERPHDIPTNPNAFYKDKGWRGYADWLGYMGSWNKNSIFAFLQTLQPVLKNLTPAELYVIIRQNGLLYSLQNKFGDSHSFMRSLREALKSPDDEAKTGALEAIILSNTPDSVIGSSLEAVTNVTTEELKAEANETDDDTQLGLRIGAVDSLKSIDSLVEGGAVRSDDAETIEFLISRKVQWYWEQVLQNKTTVETVQNATGGQYFETIQRRFLTQYNGAVELPIPAGYTFSNQPNLMQKLTAYRVQQERRLGNWSGTGAGKTLSAVLASRVIDAKITLIVANNNTIETGWVKTIPEAFPDSSVYARKGAIPHNLSSNHSYIVLNFETFQQDDAASLVHRLVEDYVIDFVVLDEIQMVKQRDETLSKRRQMVNALICGAAEKNPNLHVLGMSATPVVNNLMEAKALLEMIRGEKFDDLKTHTSIPNAIAMHEKLILHGIRYRPEYKISVDEQFVEVAGDTETLSQIRDAKTPLQLDQILLPSKIEEMTKNKWLKQGTLIYSYYVSGMIDQIEEAVRDNGFRVGRYTGEDKDGLEAFKKGQIDVLIGSSAIGTGVDGLQERCNRLIIMSLPWTSAEYEQLKGRIYRQGSSFDKVDVIIPQVFFPLEDENWSWDDIRMHRIRYKRDLASAAVDGYIPEGKLPSEAKMLADAKTALEAWIKRVEEDGLTTIVRNPLTIPLPEVEERKALHRYGEFSHLNARYNTSHSNKTHERLLGDPTEWYHYHTLYRKEREDWTEVPVNRIAGELRQCSENWIIGDFGCGEAYLSTQFPGRVISFDHVAITDDVIACDMSHTGYESDSLDVAVFSLSLMGSNYTDYLAEAHRLLKHRGILMIAEPAARWGQKLDTFRQTIREAGFTILEGQERGAQFVYLEAIKR